MISSCLWGRQVGAFLYCSLYVAHEVDHQVVSSQDSHNWITADARSVVNEQVLIALLDYQLPLTHHPFMDVWICKLTMHRCNVAVSHLNVTRE